MASCSDTGATQIGADSGGGGLAGAGAGAGGNDDAGRGVCMARPPP